MFGQSPKTLPGTCHLTMKAWISWEEKYPTFELYSASVQDSSNTYPTQRSDTHMSGLVNTDRHCQLA